MQRRALGFVMISFAQACIAYLLGMSGAGPYSGAKNAMIIAELAKLLALRLCWV